MVAGGLLGLVWAAAFSLYFWSPLEPAWEGVDIEITGQVTGLPSRFDRGWSFDFEPVGSTDSHRLPSKIRLRWYRGPAVKSGQIWQLRVRLKPPRGFRNPGGFDYERWARAQRIGASGYVRNSQTNRLLAQSKGWSSLRQQLADRIEAILAASPVRGLIKALVVGDRSGISQDQWQVLRSMGTAHLVAISGLHIGLVAGLCFWIGRRSWLVLGMSRWPADAPAIVGAIAGAAGYSALAGFSIPTQRALIMVIVVMGAVAGRRHLHPWYGWVVALWAVCLLDPWAPFSAGFWLSFGAVFLILYGLGGRLVRFGAVSGFMRVQWVLLLGLAPLLSFLFGQVPWMAPLANLVAVPGITLLVVPLALLGSAVLWALPPLGEGLLQAAALIMSGLWRPVQALAELYDQGQFFVSPPGWWVLILAMAGLLLVLAPRGLPARWLGILLVQPLVWPAANRPEQGEVWLTLLDVGQGLAAVVQTRDHVLVYDTGPRYSERFDAGRDIILPYLQHVGRQRLDKVIISHGDQDHSGGLPAVISRFPAAHLLTSDSALATHTGNLCQRGQHWRWNAVEFEMMWPKQTKPQTENDASCVLKITAPGGSVLLPGDLEAAGEQALLAESGRGLQATILLAPHHGSATSSTPGFLQAVDPRLILVASGYRNRFGFPASEVLERYRQMGSRFCDTALSGAIEVRIKPEGTIHTDSLRAHDYQYWRRTNSHQSRCIGRLS